MTIYTITAYRWGVDSNDNYIVANSLDKNEAIRIAKEHQKYRGDKYACDVVEFDTDNSTKEGSEDMFKIVYELKKCGIYK